MFMYHFQFKTTPTFDNNFVIVINKLSIIVIYSEYLTIQIIHLTI